MNSLRAQLLVASPKLPDPNFYRTVVLMIQHDEEGAFGLILNRPSEITVGEIWEEISDEPCNNFDPVNVGGPVSGPLIALHTLDDCSEMEVMPGVHLATQRDHLEQVVAESSPFRLFSGYSGWGGGQLEAEMKVGGWLTAPAQADYIFTDVDDLWKTVADDIGSEIIFSGFKHRPAADDPSLN